MIDYLETVNDLVFIYFGVLLSQGLVVFSLTMKDSFDMFAVALTASATNRLA